MTEEDFIFIISAVLSDDLDISREAMFCGYEDRCLIVWDFQLAGRISETANLKAPKVLWDRKNRCLKVKTFSTIINCYA